MKNIFKGNMRKSEQKIIELYVVWTSVPEKVKEHLSEIESGVLGMSRHQNPCLFSHRVLPAGPILKISDLAPLTPHSHLRLLYIFPSVGQQVVTPQGRLLLHHTTLHQSLRFLSIPRGGFPSPTTQSIF